jgi:uncharacterized protein (UPF0332 family)
MFEPKLFFNLAENLKNSPKDNLLEARIRTSVGRSYYAIFLATRNRVEKLVNKELENRRDVHQTIINKLKECQDIQMAEFGTNLDSLRQYRLQADYRIRTNISPNIAETAFTLANDLFDDLKSLPENYLKTLFHAI